MVEENIFIPMESIQGVFFMENSQDRVNYYYRMEIVTKGFLVTALQTVTEY